METSSTAETWSDADEQSDLSAGAEAKAQLQFKEFEQNLNRAMHENQGLSQRARIEETFHQFGQATSAHPAGSPASSGSAHESALGKEMAYAATKQVLESWDIVMTEDEDKRFRSAHFEPVWTKYAQTSTSAGDNLSNQYATAFIKDVSASNEQE